MDHQSRAGPGTQSSWKQTVQTINRPTGMATTASKNSHRSMPQPIWLFRQPFLGDSAPIDDHAASNHEQQPFSQEGLQLRHSFILDAGDEGMWRDLQLQDVDQLFPEPREQTRAIPSASRHSKDLNLVHEAQLQEPSENFERLHRSSHADAAARQSQMSSTIGRLTHQHRPARPSRFQSFVHANDFARDAYYSPQRSNAARIQSWIGKTPTGRPVLKPRLTSNRA